MRIKKILTIILIPLILFSESAFLFYPSQAKAEIVTVDLIDYCGYKSLKIINDALDKEQIIDQRRVELLWSLYLNGYFNLKTKAQKLVYLKRHVNKSPLLGIVLKAEINNNNPDCTDINNLSAQDTEKIQNELLQSMGEGIEQWIQIRNLIIANCLKKGISPSPDAPLPTGGWSANGCFLAKAYWFPTDLKVFYQLAPYFSKYASNPKFTREEVNYLASMDQKIVSYQSAPVKSIGITADNPIWDVLMFVPIEKLLQAPLSALWSRFEPIMFKGAQVSSKFVAGATGRLTEKIPQLFDFFKPKWRITLNFEVDLSRMFVYSSFTRKIRGQIASGMRDAFYVLINDPFFKKYFSKDIVFDILSKTRVMQWRSWLLYMGEQEAEAKTVGGVTRFSAGKLQQISLDEITFFNMANKIPQIILDFVHECMHAAAKHIDLCVKDMLGEGAAEFYAQKWFKMRFPKSTSPIMGPYNDERIIYGSLEEVFMRKFGEKVGSEKLADIYFQKGLPGINAALGDCVYEHLNDLLIQGRYADANDYILSLMPSHE